MKSSFRPLFAVSAILSLASCDKPLPPAATAPVAAETDNQLAEARDALQRQALEIETKTALMDKQLAEMAQSLKERDNAELRDSLDALKRQNDELRVQADAARQQSNAITQRIVVTPQPNVVPQPMALPDYSLFYDRLAPFGRWFEVNGYGYCWRPTITVAGWRPYVDGCWVWSSLGWAWQSNEPFGWATYHYGRWVNLARYGWIWVPGSEWAPAWVAWRQSRDCVGWAPLPPETGVFSGAYRDCDSRYGLGPTSYTFINTTQFVSPTYINIYAPVTRQTTIFQHSVNVTQIVPSHSQRHAFFHQGGPPRSQMEQACGRPVPQRQVQTMHADQMPTRPQHHGRRDADAPVAMVELPAVAPGAHMRRPEIKEHIPKPVLMGGFEGVPQQAAREIRENIAQEKETAVVQQQPPPMRGHMQHGPGRRPVEPPTVVNAPPAVPGAILPETVRPASPSDPPAVAPATAPVETATVQQQPGQGSMPQGSRRHSPEGRPATNLPAQETVRPAVAVEPGAEAAREPRRHGQPSMGVPQVPNVSPESKVVENSPPAAAPSTPAVMPAVVENKAPEPSAAPVVPVVEPERTAAPAVMPQPPAEPSVSPQPVAAEVERTRMHAGREQAQAAAMEQRQQQEMQDRAMAEKSAAEQAAANAEAEKSRMQAAAAQQEAQAAQQQRMAADQAAETEKARQQAAATAAQQQQEMAAQQQRATAERMASEQAAAAEAERVRQQTEAAAMQQRQQEEATRRAAEEQQMKAQQETERRTQEMAAQRQAEEQARRQQEAEMQRAQEQARRAAEEQQMRAQQEAERRAQEMAQRQAEEQARRQQEAEMQRAQEQARRAAEEQQMRAQQEAAQRAQEMAQRQAEEQARRAQEMAQRQAEEQARRAQEEAQRAAAEAAQRAAAEAAQRAAAEAARNQPQPAPGS